MSKRLFRTSYDPISTVSFYGQLKWIDFKGYRFLFDLEGRIKWIIPLKAHLWPGPDNYLRRTLGNHWLLYESGGYAGVYELTGRYYFPVPLYNSLSPWSAPKNSFQLDNILALLDELALKYPIYNTNQLKNYANQLYRVLKSTLPVLPPDSINVEYDLIPIVISRGCLHNCLFCSVKTNSSFDLVSEQELQAQMEDLQTLIGKDLINYSSLFVGQNDGLAAGVEKVAKNSCWAFDFFNIGSAIMAKKNLFLFGSATSFLSHENKRFLIFDALPFDYIFLNLGLESFHGPTLNMLGKPITAREILEAFKKAMDLVSYSQKIQISFNFVLGKKLPKQHLQILEHKLSSAKQGLEKCIVYLSPLQNEHWRAGELARTVLRLKAKSRFKLYLYFIVPL